MDGQQGKRKKRLYQKLKLELAQGQYPPWYYGAAYHNWIKGEIVFYVYPFNLFVGFFMMLKAIWDRHRLKMNYVDKQVLEILNNKNRLIDYTQLHALANKLMLKSRAEAEFELKKIMQLLNLKIDDIKMVVEQGSQDEYYYFNNQVLLSVIWKFENGVLSYKVNNMILNLENKDATETPNRAQAQRHRV